MSPAKRPIFVGGQFKSGTSLLRAMLGQHPSIATGLETYWFMLDWADRNGVEMQDRFERLAALYDLDPEEVKALVAHCSSRTEFLDRFMGNIAARAKKARWAEKTPGNVFHMPEIFSQWPEAQVMHIFRDPRDVYVSMREACKIGDPRAFAEQWVTFASAVKSAKAAGLCSSTRFLELSYEDLVLKTRETFGALLDFLGEAWDEGVASFHGRPDEFEKVQRVTNKKSTTLKRLRGGMTESRIGIWRSRVAAEDLRAIEVRVRELGLIDEYLARYVDTR
jgi:hypothetical protein